LFPTDLIDSLISPLLSG